MTTIASTKLNTKYHNLKKNKTGLFAANSIHDIKSSRNHLMTGATISSRFRNNSLSSLLFPPTEQKQEIEQYDPIDENNSSNLNSSNNSQLTLNVRRNGFPPATILHQKIRLPMTTTTCQSTEKKFLPSKSTNTPSHASARLKSEIDYLRNKLQKHEQSSKSFRFRDNRDLDGTRHGTVSYSTSCRLPSASTILTADRIHKRFSSAVTHNTTSTNMIKPTINDASTQTMPILSNIITTINPPIIETDDNQSNRADYQPTHAYQIPQQSNVGSECVFFTDSSMLSSFKTRSIKTDRYHNDLKTIACPFYVMYFTNLTMQQGQTKDNNNENEIASSTTRKVPVNSRTSTAFPRHQSTRRQVNSQLNLDTYLTTDDNVYVTDSTKIPLNENSSKLKDILRTKSWNHVRV
ncbi:unnamed protein product [Adineta steineri]|uniref:Uncharacterized protein n=2 Tax=Adineta steineri TaxID=433720 RepID=A0A814S0Y6_9BILA|nr:unnamed protein product [Adineta steineri]